MDEPRRSSDRAKKYESSKERFLGMQVRKLDEFRLAHIEEYKAGKEQELEQLSEILKSGGEIKVCGFSKRTHHQVQYKVN